MKRVYVEPKMEMEEFGAEQAIMAGNCVPGVKEQKNTEITVTCILKAPGNSGDCSHPQTVQLFTSSLECNTKVNVPSTDEYNAMCEFGMANHNVGINRVDNRECPHKGYYNRELDPETNKPLYFNS